MIHLAGFRDPSDATAAEYKSLLEMNLLSLVAALKACGPQTKRFIYLSSMSVYSENAVVPSSEEDLVEPSTPYSLSKWLGEKACELYKQIHPDLDLVIIRLAQVYGPGSPHHLALYQMIMSALSQGEIRLNCTSSLCREHGLSISAAARP